ncbi:OVARIAN TUMOR DOMAIN-containing deubiquitinating enzyme 9-like [Solanum dulcamara]|uniref:OVARIAN TUMOR DOMAIN-containing deubiquitinating enzyme 9-like n=1 Tax=Solanum dulcamara TaxID=45834 RepID=UPI002485015F|nr:OVARIAN TUMOR DOMAIN-containing deubiquitinating enzyme 9-like [Solanum dulcamara]
MSWNLRLTEVCRINNGASPGSSTQYYRDFPQLGYVTIDYNHEPTQYVNNDLIVHEELSAKSDHQRLMERLELYEFVEQQVSGDGNCQFRSISDQIYGSSEHHRLVREQVVKQLKSNKELYEGYVPMVEYDEYLNRVSKCGEWGDHVTLQAAADSYGVKIFVITSFKDTCYIEILPRNRRHHKIIFLSFCAELHYNSIYPEEEYPGEETRKNKKW